MSDDTPTIDELATKSSDRDKILRALELPQETVEAGGAEFLIRALPFGDQTYTAFLRAPGLIDEGAFQSINAMATKLSEVLVGAIEAYANQTETLDPLDVIPIIDAVKAQIEVFINTVRSDALVDPQEISKRRTVAAVIMGVLDRETGEPIYTFADEDVDALRSGNWPVLSRLAGAIQALSVAPSLEDSKRGTPD